MKNFINKFSLQAKLTTVTMLMAFFIPLVLDVRPEKFLIASFFVIVVCLVFIPPFFWGSVIKQIEEEDK